MLIRRSRRVSVYSSSSSLTFPSSSILLVSLRSYFRDDISKGVKSETERGGPKRVPSMRPDRTLVDPSFRSTDEIREEFDRENEQIELESAKMRATYSGSYNARAAAAGLEQRIGGAKDGAGSKTSGTSSSTGSLGTSDAEIDLEESIRNATPSRGQYSAVDPDDNVNPHRQNHSGYGGFDDRTSAAQESFLSGSIHDRESIRVRGQKPPPDLPITDDEVWQHPTAKNMRVAGIFLLFFVLDVMWNLTTDPFNEGERYTKYAFRQDGNGRDDQVNYLTAAARAVSGGVGCDVPIAHDRNIGSDKQIQAGKALRDSMLPWRQ